MKTAHPSGCHKSWWANLLYIQNLYETDACVGQAWYLANDMQFYIIAPFFILPLFYKPRLGNNSTKIEIIVSS